MSDKSASPNKLAAGAVGTIIIFACMINHVEQAVKEPLPPPTTVPSVDIERYQGTWYEISSIRSFFSIGCSQTQATYTINKDSTVKVDNQCMKNGNLSTITGTATVQDETNAKLTVSFWAGNIGEYWIVRLPDDYSYVVVSDDKYQQLFILSRTKKMQEKLYASIIDDLRKDGFQVDKLEITEQ